jgi:hypothetical protein
MVHVLSNHTESDGERIAVFLSGMHSHLHGTLEPPISVLSWFIISFSTK